MNRQLVIGHDERVISTVGDFQSGISRQGMPGCHDGPETKTTHRKLAEVRRYEQPVGLHDSFVRLPEGATVEVEELVRDGSLYRLLIDKFDMVPTEGLESVSAIAATAEDGALLGVKSGSPLLLCERVTLSERREPIEYCEMKYLPSYRYKTRIRRWSSDSE